MAPDPTLTVRRIETCCTSLAVPPPPADVELKLLQGTPADGLTLLLRWSGAESARVLAWAASWGACPVRTSTRGDSHVAICPLAALPPSWHAFAPPLVLHQLSLRPDGGANVHVEGPADAIAAMAQDLESTLPKRSPTTELTGRQDEALRAAASLGYYTIPRPATLKELAAELGVSVASSSELLRRAENLVLLQHVAGRRTGTAVEGSLRTRNEELAADNADLQRSSDAHAVATAAMQRRNDRLQTRNDALEAENDRLQRRNDALRDTNRRLTAANDESAERNADLTLAADFLRRVVDAAARAIVVCDDGHRVLLWNQTATRLFGLPEPLAPGTDLFRLLPGFDTPAIRAAIQAALGGRPVDVDRFDAGARPLRVNVTPVAAAPGTPLAVVLAASPVPAAVA